MTSPKIDRDTPASRGVDSKLLLKFFEAVERRQLALHNFILYRGGAVVAEAYWSPYDANVPHMQHSAAKSWTATAIGFAIDEGLLSLADKVVSFFPEHLPAEVSENLAAMTLEDLLTMRTGHRSGVSGGEWRRSTESWISLFLREPVESKPGVDFIYNSGSSYMLSAILTRVTGRTTKDYLTQRLFEPLQMDPIGWDLSPEGVSTGGNGITCTTEDMLKLGILHLRDGVWNGKQILSSDWVRAATRYQVREVWMAAFDGKRFLPRTSSVILPEQRREGYGYQWWRTLHNGFMASGLFGQHCVVLPDYDAVIALTAAIPEDNPLLLPTVWENVLPALGDAAGVPPASRAFDAEFARQVSQLRLPVIEGAGTSPLQSTVDGKRYAVRANDEQIDEVMVSFDGETCRFTLTDHRGVHTIVAGLRSEVSSETTMTGNRLHHQYQPDRMRVVANAAWQGDGTLKLMWRFVETAFTDEVVLRFSGPNLTMDRSVNVNTAETSLPTIFGTAAA